MRKPVIRLYEHDHELYGMWYQLLITLDTDSPRFKKTLNCQSTWDANDVTFFTLVFPFEVNLGVRHSIFCNSSVLPAIWNIDYALI
jgi:hypothetical protein